jgi:biopolymer transport protein ExbD
MKLKRSRSYRRGRIEIIPMIDVMFFLPVTFMLASLAMQNVLRPDPPITPATAAPPPCPTCRQTAAASGDFPRLERGLPFANWLVLVEV